MAGSDTAATRSIASGLVSAEPGPATECRVCATEPPLAWDWPKRLEKNSPMPAPTAAPPATGAAEAEPEVVSVRALAAAVGFGASAGFATVRPVDPSCVGPSPADGAIEGLRHAVGAVVRGGVNCGAGLAAAEKDPVEPGCAATEDAPGAALRVAVDQVVFGTFDGRDRTDATDVGIVVRVVVAWNGTTPDFVWVENVGMLGLLDEGGGATGAAVICDGPRIGVVGARLDKLWRGSTRRIGAFARGGTALTMRGPDCTGPPGACIDAELAARGVEVASAGALSPASRYDLSLSSIASARSLTGRSSLKNSALLRSEIARAGCFCAR